MVHATPTAVPTASGMAASGDSETCRHNFECIALALATTSHAERVSERGTSRFFDHVAFHSNTQHKSRRLQLAPPKAPRPPPPPAAVLEIIRVRRRRRTRDHPPSTAAFCLYIVLRTAVDGWRVLMLLLLAY